MHLLIKMFLVTTGMVITLMSFGNMSEMSSCDILRVTLLTDSPKLNLSENRSATVTVRVENLSKDTIKLDYEPVFRFRKTTSTTNRIRLGEAFSGRMKSFGGSKDSLIIAPGQQRDFTIGLANLEVVDSLSSIDVWEDLFSGLQPGEYNLCSVVWLQTPSGEEKVKDFESNPITLTIDDRAHGKSKV